MIIVSGKVGAAPGAVAKVRSEMETVIRATREEAGCLDYSYGVDVLDPNTIIVLEYWEDWAALEAHFKAPHMTIWSKTLGAASVTSRDIKAVEAGETRSL